jgi:cytochrome c553
MSLRSLLKAAAPMLVLAAASLFTAVPAEAAGDPVRGKTLGYTCLGCHGIETYKNVYPTYSVPKLRGQNAAYIVAALKAYRSGERSHGTMHAHATSLSDQDAEDIAAYLSGQALPHDPAATPVGTPPAAVAACQSCHGPAGVGNTAMNPVPATLAGQHADYLAHAIESYRNGARKNAFMQVYVAPLKPEDIAVIAEFYAKQRPQLKTLPLKEKK